MLGRSRSDPRILLGISLLMSASLVAILVWEALTIRWEANGLSNDLLDANRLAAEVVYLDAIVDHSTRMAVLQPDRGWDDQYQAHFPLLENAVAEAGAYAEDGLLPPAAVEELHEASEELADTREQVFEALGSSNHRPAEQLLGSPTYEEAVSRQTAAVQVLNSEVQLKTRRRVQGALTRSEHSLTIAASAFLATALIGLRLARSLRRWRLSLDEADQTREQLAVVGVQHAAREARATELSEYDRLLNRLVANAPISIFALDANGVFTMAKGRVIDGGVVKSKNLRGLSMREVYAHVPLVVDAVDRAMTGEQVRSVLDLDDGSAYQAAYVPLVSKELDRDGEQVVSGVVGIYTDISDRTSLERQLYYQAEHDGLTGLLNREAFGRSLAAAFEHDRASATLCVVDLDGFKEVNDTLGHEVGDRLLVEIAHRMLGSVRDGAVLARLGGDEFGILVRGCETTIQVNAMVSRLLSNVARPIDDRTGLIDVTASIGVVGPGLDGRSSEEVMRNADLAMYEAKRRGRNRFERFNSSMSESFIRRITLKGELERAIADNQLRLFLQPIWDSVTGAAVGVEALVRWEHPTRGLLGPAEFLPLAENTGLVSALDRWMIFATCQTLRAWRDLGDPALDDLWAAVNISALDFGYLEVDRLVASALEQAGVPPTALVVEITETSLMQQVDDVVLTLDALSEMGVRIALDDFGAGYSSFSQLRQLGVDILKVDRSFVVDGTDAASAALTNTIVGLGAQLGMSVVAEGIETEAERATMAAMGCEYLQGYALARPMPPESCLKLLLNHAAELSQPNGTGL